MIAVRVHLSEHPSRVDMWCQLVDDGIDPHVAFYLSSHWQKLGGDNAELAVASHWWHSALDQLMTAKAIHQWRRREVRTGAYIQMASESLKYTPCNAIWGQVTSRYAAAKQMSDDLRAMFTEAGTVTKAATEWATPQIIPTYEQIREVCQRVQDKA